MKESIHKYFQVGTIQWMSHPKVDLLESLRKIGSDDYFDAIEICRVADDETRQKAKDILTQSGLKVCYGAQPRLLGPKLNPNDIDEEGRKAAEKTLMEGVDEAHFFGCTGMAMLSGRWEEETKEQAYSQLIKTVKNVCDYAATKGITINLEVFDYDMAKEALIGPAPLAARFAADMRNLVSNFGLLVDLSHFPTTYETSKFVIQTLRPYINHFHIGNAVVKPGFEAYGDEHPRFGYPDSANGVPELLDFLQVLKAEGFFNAKEPYVMSFEVKPWGDEDPDLILANSKRALNRAWALLED